MCFVLLSIFMLYMTSSIMSSAISVSISQLIMQFALLDPFREVTHTLKVLPKLTSPWLYLTKRL